MKSIRIVASAVASLAIALPAHAVLIPNTGISGPDDPNWSVMWRQLQGGSSSGSLTQAPLVPSVFGVWQPNVPGNNWIGADYDATVPGAVGNGSRRFEYAFTTSINLPAAQTVTGAIGYDNFFVGGYYDGTFDTGTGTYTPGTQFASPLSLLGAGKEQRAGFCRDADGFLPTISYPTCTVNFAFDLPAGPHTITFVIQGDGTTDGFILNQRGVSVNVPEPGTLVLLGLALAGLGFARRKNS